ncbi:UDP-glycosyltransferase 71A16-like [Ziziphus jujuba]|uniref:Glycosyltransferase n=1 Tax=Ziziphus jujuba TaxID=326968 RepID=A0A6P3ZYM4_ZIZJJ|nr:UDP-glycosyltransferase 71A16-like [Ziziphus jujuba]
MKKAELVFIPTPAMGHLVSTVEFAKLLVTRNHQLFITILLTKVPFDSKVEYYIDSLSASSSISQRISFIVLPYQEHTSIDANPLVFITSFMEDKKPHVKNALSNHFHHSKEAAATGSDSPRLAGLVVDMFSTAMIDVANELGVPSYVYFTSGAGYLGLLFQLLSIDATVLYKKDFSTSTTELISSSFENPVPVSVLPDIFLEKVSAEIVVSHARKIRETKGVVVNTFMELESHAIHSLLLDGTYPSLYPIGPIISLKSNNFSDAGYSRSDILNWLDEQPPSSVLFLCFGSTGSFSENQVEEISTALENCGIRFLWSLRQPPLKENKEFLPCDYEDPKQVLSQEFLDRTARIGKIIGWAPQVDILSHGAIGGFVSHCGWNSILESIWFGVPIAAWPVEAEQQLNAFQLVKELGLAVEIKLDYRNNTSLYDQNEDGIVSAQQIELGIKRLMGLDNEARNKIKLMSEKCKKALKDGGSSHSSLNNLIKAVMDV